MERVIELLNSTVAVPIDLTKVQLSPPSLSTVQANTLVTIDGLLKNGYYGHHPFRYNRVDLDGITEREIVVGAAESMTGDLLISINMRPIFSYTIGPSHESFRKKGFLLLKDIVNEPFDALLPGTSSRIVVRASTTSYLFTGSLKLRLVRP